MTRTSERLSVSIASLPWQQSVAGDLSVIFPSRGWRQRIAIHNIKLILIATCVRWYESTKIFRCRTNWLVVTNSKIWRDDFFSGQHSMFYLCCMIWERTALEVYLLAEFPQLRSKHNNHNLNGQKERCREERELEIAISVAQIPIVKTGGNWATDKEN